MTVYLHPHSKEDLVAQLVEHLPFKEVVLGSSPSQVTKKNTKLQQNPANLMIGGVFNFLAVSFNLILFDYKSSQIVNIIL